MLAIPNSRQLLLLLLLFFWLITPSPAMGEPANLSQGLNNYKNQEYESALVEFKALVLENPAHAMGHFYMALTLSKLGRNGEAVASFKKAIQLDPDLTNAHLSLGIAYYKIEDHENAVLHLNQALVEDTQNSTVQLFLGLTRQSQGQYDTSNTHFEEVAGKESKFHQLALFNIGLNYYKMGNPESAQIYFSQSAEAGPQTKLGQSARRLLDILAGGKREAKRWKLKARLGFKYDDNITRVEQDIVSGEADTALITEVKGAYKLIRTSAFGLEMKYDFFQSVFFDQSDLDLQSHDFNLSGTYDTGPVKFGAHYRYDYNTLGKSNFFEVSNPGGKASFFLSSNWYAILQYEFKNKNFFEDNRRDAENHSAGLSHFWFFENFKSYVFLGYRVEQEDADTDQFDFVGHLATLGYKTPLPLGSSVKLSFIYNLKDYSDVTPSIGRERRENKYFMKITLSRPITQYLEAQIQYGYNISNSNFPVTDYKKNIIFFGLEFKI